MGALGRAVQRVAALVLATCVLLTTPAAALDARADGAALAAASGAASAEPASPVRAAAALATSQRVTARGDVGAAHSPGGAPDSDGCACHCPTPCAATTAVLPAAGRADAAVPTAPRAAAQRPAYAERRPTDVVPGPALRPPIA